MRIIKRVFGAMLAAIMLICSVPATPAEEQPKDASDLKAGDYISFGAYDGIPIRWKVLDLQGDRALLHCSEELLYGEFDASMQCWQSKAIMAEDIYGSVDWPGSDARRWLNSGEPVVIYDNSAIYPYPKSMAGLMRPTGGWGIDDPEPSYSDLGGFLCGYNFTAEERCLIADTTHRVHQAVNNPDYPGASYVRIGNLSWTGISNLYESYGMAELNDEVFLLNSEEYVRYCDIIDQQVYDRDRDTWVSTMWYLADSIGSMTGLWYLYDTYVTAAYVEGGKATIGTESANDKDILIRPACNIELSYVLGISGSGTFEDPYTLEIDRSVLSRAKAKNLYRDQPDEWSITVKGNQDTLDSDREPRYILLKDAVITSNDIVYRTEEDGTRVVPFYPLGITVSKEGYISRTLTPDQLKENSVIYLERQRFGPTVSGLWVDGTDVIHQELQIDLMSSPRSTVSAEVDWGIDPESGNAMSPGKIYLYQNGRSVELTRRSKTIHWKTEFDIANPIEVITVPKEMIELPGMLEDLGGGFRYKLKIRPWEINPLTLDDFTFSLFGDEMFEYQFDIEPFKGVKATFLDDQNMPLKIKCTVKDGRFRLVGGLNLDWKKGQDGDYELETTYDHLKSLQSKIDDKLVDNRKALEDFYADNPGKVFGHGKGKWGFTCEFDLMVFAEGYVDCQGNLIFTDGGTIISAGAEQKFNYPVALYGIPGYLAVKFAEELTTQFDLLLDNHGQNTGFRPMGKLDFQFSIGGEAGLGYNGVIGAGIGLKGIYKHTHHFTDQLAVTYKKGTVEVVPTAHFDYIIGSVGGDIEAWRIYNKTLYEEPKPRSATAVKGIQTAKAADYSLPYSYPVSEPMLVSLDDGKLLSLWLGSAEDPDSRRLEARYFDGSSWSEPFAVDPEDVTMDLQPYAFFGNNKAYVAWVDLDCSVSGMTLGEIAPHTRIRMASFDENSRTFTVYNVSEADGTLQMNPILSRSGSDYYCFYIKNDGLSWDGTAGSNRVFSAVENNGTLSIAEEVCSLPGRVESMVSIGGELYAAADTDGDPMTMDDMEIFLNGEQITDNGVRDSGLIKAHGYTYWEQDGTLVIRDTDISDDPVPEGGVVPGYKPVLLSNGDGNRVLLYLDNSGEDGSNRLTARFSRNDVWSENEITLTDGRLGVIDFSAALGANGSIELALLCADSPDSEPRIEYMSVPRIADPTPTGVTYDGGYYVSGSDMQILAKISNEGTGVTGTFVAEILDGDQVIASRRKSPDIAPGASATLPIQIPVGEIVNGRELTLRLRDLSGSDSDPGNNEVVFTLSQSDLAVEHIRWGLREDGKVSILADVVNRGYSVATDTVAELRLGGPDGETVDSVPVSSGGLLSLDNVSFTVDFEEDACYYVCLTNADHSYTDDNVGNNNDFVVLQTETHWEYPDPTPLPPVPPTPGLPCSGGEDCPGRIFTDMPKKSNWAHDPIDWAVVYGITNGTTKTTFSPKDPCTRGQIVTFLWRAAGSPEPNSDMNPFTDVKKSDFYYKAVLWAVEKGVTNGMTKTTFAPKSPCTRSQVVTFLWRTCGEPAPGSPANPFTDVKNGQWYTDAVLWAVENDVTNGTSATTFSPSKTCTRAEIVAFLYRAKDMLK